MRLLLVIYGRLEQVSGGYLYDRKVVEFLRNRGEEVDILRLPPLLFQFLFRFIAQTVDLEPYLERQVSLRPQGYKREDCARCCEKRPS